MPAYAAFAAMSYLCALPPTWRVSFAMENSYVEFLKLWTFQTVPQPLRDQLTRVCPETHTVISVLDTDFLVLPLPPDIKDDTKTIRMYRSPEKRHTSR